MLTIAMPVEVTPTEFQDLAKQWDLSADVTIEVPMGLSAVQLRHLFAVALDILPNEFAFTLLADLAEHEDAPLDLLEILFAKGDVACKETICLRTDLNEGLMEACRNYKPQHGKRP